MAESTRHRLAFNLYFYLGPRRSLEELRRALLSDPGAFGFKQAPGLRTLYRWSARYGWQDRVGELEVEARRQARAQQVDALQKMNDRHAREGQALQQKAVQRLQTLADDELSPEAAVRALVEGVKLERLATGEATERTALEGGISVAQVDLANFSEEELRSLAGLGPSGPRRARAPAP